MRGRKPKPERLKVLDGQVRFVGSTEPPQAPDWLEGEAREEWDRVVAELSKTCLVSPLDALSLASYCRVYAMWREADRQVKEHGITFISDNGNIRCNPAAKLCLSLFEALRRMGAEFGFTPSARSRISLSPPKTEEVDEFDNFLEAR